MQPQPGQSGHTAFNPQDGPPADASDLDGGPDDRPDHRRGPATDGTIVVKIGGSTLGAHDTTLEDLVALQRQGASPVVVHGGGQLISQWMETRGVRPRFVRGLRVTDAPSLEIVIAILAGLVNKELVARIVALGGKAIGISGADGGMLEATVSDPELGLVGTVTRVNTEPVEALLGAGYIPVVAPLGFRTGQTESLLNVNGDTAAGAIAAALGSERLVFLTDVEGVLDSSRRLIPRITERQARGLVRSAVVVGGMRPKIEACLAAVKEGSVTQIVDGRRPGALSRALSGEPMGTRVG